MDMDIYTPAFTPVREISGVELAILVVIVVVIICYIGWKWWTQFSDEELSELSDTMMYFHENPTADDFARIWTERDRLIRHTGKPVRFWCYGAYLTHPEFYNDEQTRELNTWMNEITRGLRRVKNNPNSIDIDCIWSLYFATGRDEYPEIVRKIALDDAIPYHVRSAANWSYRSIMKQKPTPAQETTEPEGPAEAPDVIILPNSPVNP